MAFWAELDTDDIVLRVIRFDADLTEDGVTELDDPPVALLDTYGGTWRRTFFATPPHIYAGVGWRCRSDLHNFVPPQPFPSWVLDGDLRWQPPEAPPRDGYFHDWDEATRTWTQ